MNRRDPSGLSPDGNASLAFTLFGDPSSWPRLGAKAGATAGAFFGGMSGGLGGGAGGTLVAPGVGTIGGAVAGAAYGAAQGAVLGGAAGYAVGNVGMILMNQNSNGSNWSGTNSLSPEENAAAHAEKHAGEFPEIPEGGYVQAAQDFVQNPPAGTLSKIRPNGDTLLYNPATNTFAVRTSTGVPRTMFKPGNGLDYWNKQ